MGNFLTDMRDVKPAEGEQPVTPVQSSPARSDFRKGSDFFHTLGIVFVSLVVGLALAAVGMYWWMYQKQAKLDSKLTELQNQILELQHASRTQAPAESPLAVVPDETVNQHIDEETNGGIKVNKTTVYRNSALRFQMSFPSGWYLPGVDDKDPHMYSCASFKCKNGGLEIQRVNDGAGKSFEEVLAGLTPDDAPGAKEVPSFVTGARIIKSGAGAGVEGWLYQYLIVFTEAKITYRVFTDNPQLEVSILSTFKILP